MATLATRLSYAVDTWGEASPDFREGKEGAPRTFQRASARVGPILTGLGIVPTALMLVGFVAALRESLRRRARTPDAPLVVMSVLGLAVFVAFTLRAPSAVAVKASYLLPLLVPAAVFFARGVDLLGVGRRTALALAGSAALASGVVFTNGLVFPRITSPELRDSVYAAEREGASPMDELHRELRAASLGRWNRVAPPIIAADGGLHWWIEVHDFPAVRPEATTAWCGYFQELMSERLPGRRWTASFLQNRETVRTCDGTSRRSGA